MVRARIFRSKMNILVPALCLRIQIKQVALIGLNNASITNGMEAV